MNEAPEPGLRHCFVVPAFGRSPYLGECLASLRAQDEPSEILISTSTPNAHIRDLAKEYSVPVHEVPANKGIGADWNAALLAAPSAWVTLAHQDDIYLPRYSRVVRQSLARHGDALLCFTSYREIGVSGLRRMNRNLWIKQALIHMAFLNAPSIGSARRKLALLAFGSPIPCPSVTLNLARLGTFHFSNEHKTNLDWRAWLELAPREGSFVRIREVLMYHRIHEIAETWTRILDGTRHREDIDCFAAVWPRPIAVLLSHLYSLSYRANRT